MQVTTHLMFFNFPTAEEPRRGNVVVNPERKKIPQETKEETLSRVPAVIRSLTTFCRWLCPCWLPPFSPLFFRFSVTVCLACGWVGSQRLGATSKFRCGLSCSQLASPHRRRKEKQLEGCWAWGGGADREETHLLSSLTRFVSLFSSCKCLQTFGIGYIVRFGHSAVK